jgi:hypothetical protein
MTELQLFRYIHENNIEWHRQDNDGTPDILIFPYVFQLEDFCKLVKGYNIDDGGLIIRLMNGYVAIWMGELCEYYGINMDNVFIGEGITISQFVKNQT